MITRTLAKASKQRGVLMVALMAGIAIVLILSTVAVQSWADVTRRDKEAEMMFRAQDIVRALKRFQADRGKLPTELKEMMEPGQKRQYVLRQLWKDPLVKDGKWQLVYASPSGGIFDPSVPATPDAGGGGAAPLPGLSQTRAPASETGAPPSLGLGFGGQPGAGTGDPAGMPIAGVKSKSTDKPFRVYKDKTQYSEWIFTIFDLEPQGQPPPGQNPPGQNPQGLQGQQGKSPFGNPGTTPATDQNKTPPPPNDQGQQ